MTLIVDALSVYRLTRLVTTDRVTRSWRNRIEGAAPDSLGYLVSCDWCVSSYVAAGVVAARRFAPRAWDPLARALAFSAVAGIVATELDR